MSEKKAINIGAHRIGPGRPVFVVAELSANHMRSFSLAVKTIRAAKKAGADAVKMQTYTPDDMTIDSGRKYFRIRHKTLWDGQTLYELYKRAYTPWEWYPRLKKAAVETGITLFSTPFTKAGADFLQAAGVPAYKIASFEITDVPFIEHVAAKGKPVIISTGIAARSEIAGAVAACRRKGNDKIVLLKCASVYPAPPEDANLAMIPRLTKDFGCLSGLSDHSRGIASAIASVPLGASVIEKHFILDKKLKGPDSVFSADPGEFRAMADAVRIASAAIGRAGYALSPQAAKNRVFSRSLFIVKDMKKGAVMTDENVRSIRPGHGMKPVFLRSVLGRRVTRDVKRGTPLSRELVGRKNGS